MCIRDRGKTEIKDPGHEHTVNPDPSVPEVTAPPAEQAPPSNEPVPGSSNGNGAVYDPVFGWVVPGNVQPVSDTHLFGETPAETDDQSAAPTDMPENFDVQPPDVYEDNADAVQEPPASPKPCLLYTSRFHRPVPTASMSWRFGG